MFKGNTILERMSPTKYKMRSTLSFVGSTHTVTVSEGFVTDGASIPRAFYTLIGCPYNGQYIGSAIIHDALYNSRLLPKVDADRMFLEMLKDNGVGAVKRNLMYWAVKFFGKSSYNATTANQAAMLKLLVKVEPHE